MKQHKVKILGVALLLAFAGLTMASFKDTLTPYVPYEKARTLNRTVQVAGGLAEGTTSYDEPTQSLIFTLQEPETGEEIRIRYSGVKPANFEEAISIVAIGKYEAGEDAIVAEKLLVKCPSKYQGSEMEEKVYS